MQRFAIVFLVWLLAAVVFAGTVDLTAVPRPAIPIIVWGSVLLFFSFYWRGGALRNWVSQLDLRWLIGFHIVRLPIGVAFLIFGSRGELAPEFANLAGYGDILAGGLAGVVLLACPPLTATRRRVLFAWNVIGLLDILLVFATAQRVLWFGSGFDGLLAFTYFPVPIIPVFVVPIVLIAHFLVFARLAKPCAGVQSM